MSWVKISKGEMKGWMKEDLVPLFPPSFFEDPAAWARQCGARVVKDSRRRWASILALPGGKEIFLKRDLTKDWTEFLKFLLLPSKAQKEWFIASQARRRNVVVPDPLGWLDRSRGGFVRESYYLSEAVRSGVALIDHPEVLEEEAIFERLVKAVRRIHDSGLLHLDFHGGNFLWDGEAFFLIDLHRAKFVKTLSLTRRLWTLSHLFHSLRSSWGEAEALRFLETYFEGDPVDSKGRERGLKKVRAWMDRLQKRQWASRTKRCMKESTEFSVAAGKDARYYHRRDFPLGDVEEAVEKHRRICQGRTEELVKNSSEVSVSIFEHRGERVSVKELRYPRPLDRFKERFRRSKGLKAWVAGNGLRARGIASLRPLAIMEKRDCLGLRETFFLLEASERGLEMDRYLLRGFKDFGEKRRFIRAFALWLSAFHKMNLYHKDMKTCNVLVEEREGAWRFLLLDLEDVLLDTGINEEKVFRNFLQLNTSIPGTLTRRDRLCFFREYLSLHPIVRKDRVFLRRLSDKGRQRGIVYVSPEGVVEEQKAVGRKQ